MEVPEGALHPAVATGEAMGAHNGVALIIEQQEPQQCEEQDTNSIGQIHLQLLMLASITAQPFAAGQKGPKLDNTVNQKNSLRLDAPWPH